MANTIFLGYLYKLRINQGYYVEQQMALLRAIDAIETNVYHAKQMFKQTP